MTRSSALYLRRGWCPNPVLVSSRSFEPAGFKALRAIKFPANLLGPTNGCFTSSLIVLSTKVSVALALPSLECKLSGSSLVPAPLVPTVPAPGASHNPAWFDNSASASEIASRASACAESSISDRWAPSKVHEPTWTEPWVTEETHLLTAAAKARTPPLSILSKYTRAIGSGTVFEDPEERPPCSGWRQRRGRGPRP